MYIVPCNLLSLELCLAYNLIGILTFTLATTRGFATFRIFCSRVKHVEAVAEESCRALRRGTREGLYIRQPRHTYRPAKPDAQMDEYMGAGEH